MKKFLSGCALSICLAAPAVAADMPVKAPPPAAVVTVFNWTGIYVGGHGGYAWGDVDWTVNPPAVPPPFHASNHINGAVGGAHAGFLYQWNNNLVIGAEVSWTGGDIDKSFNALFAGFTRTFDARVRSLFLATARAGLAYGRFLPYVKGGFASAEVRTELIDVNGGFGPGTLISVGKSRQNGWTAGGGIDYALSDNIVFGVEYNYVRLNSKTYSNADLAAGAGAVTIHHENVDPSFSTILGRLTFRFAPGAVVARY